ncbi:MAG: ComEC/Rec2 family competence protein [Paracoccaceae bacterium]
MGAAAHLRIMMLEQRGHLFNWIPVGLAFGIGLFFTLRFEPSFLLIGTIALGGLLFLALAARLGEVVSPLAGLIGVVALGFVLAAWRTHSVAAPVIDWRYYGAVEGRVVGIDRSASDALRITLDNVVLERVSPQETPRRVRLSLHGDAVLGDPPIAGARMMTTAHLSPPGGPVEPGGFDFQRHAWFNELGAVGYSRVPLLTSEAARNDPQLWVFSVRMAISYRVQEALPGDVGGFAAAVTTGDRSGISREGLEALRASNTAHLLAISGLHMGLLTGFIFGLLRLVFAAIPYIALRWPTRKMAAIGALIVAAAYLALSGGNVATERAFVMVAVALSAILINRRAISLRSVAIAAIIVLFLRPEALLSPGFQMSFAATTALVAVFGMMRDQKLSFGPRWLQPVLGVVMSSAIAGLATAPIGAAHFNAIAHYGLIANLLSVPLMGVLVIPAAVLAACLAPIGAEIVGLWLMGLGLRWILGVATWITNLDGARSFVPGPDAAILPLLSLGCLLIILWHGRARWSGLLPVVAAFGLWAGAERPQVLIAETGGLVGVMLGEGRALSKSRGGGFIASNWLENDGDRADQALAASRWPLSDGQIRRVALDDWVLIHLQGKRNVAAYDACGAGEIVIATHPLSLRGCEVFDPKRLARTGAVALELRGGVIMSRSTRDITGDRIWSGWPYDRRTDIQKRGWWLLALHD